MIEFRALVPTNSIWYKVLYSYLPIAVTMAAESIIVSITSCVCMLVPYTLLAKKASCNPSTLTLDFDQSPPHFQFIRSIRARHLPLTALNIAIYLGNVLAVGLAVSFLRPVCQSMSTCQLKHFPLQPSAGSQSHGRICIMLLLNTSIHLRIPYSLKYRGPPLSITFSHST